MDTLKLYRGDLFLTQVAFGERPVELGRGAACDVTLDDPGLAERHWLAVRRLGSVIAYDVSVGRSGQARPLPLGERVALGREHSVIRERAGVERERAPRDTESLELARTPCRRLCVVVGSGREARRLRIGERPLHIGRGVHNDLVLEDTSASLCHCRLEPSDEGLVLRDLGSSNGTFVNGVRIERVVLTQPARIRVGRSELTLIERDEAGRVAGSTLIAASPRMLALVAEAERAASLCWPALVLGESGSGKEGIATLLHARGARAGKPFVALNAGGVPRELIESELFGHERGAFTGASMARRGVFEQADTGTLFLDEIGELPHELQARLLRVLESGELRRVGAEGVRRVDVRVVCATHRDLRAMVEAGTFREDLFFRLARLVLEVPPLRERPEDIAALSEHFLAELEPMVGRRQLDKDARVWLCKYPWPGNVRELRNVLSAAAFALNEPRIGRAELVRVVERLSGVGRRRDEPSAAVLTDALAHYGGNQSATARALRMPRSTLRDRLKQLQGDSL